MKRLLLLFALTLLLGQLQAQSPKKIKAKGDYVHAPTSAVFPLQLGDYHRDKLYSYDKKKENVGGVYESANKKTLLSVYVYPAGNGYDRRIHDEYSELMQELANYRGGLHAISNAVSYQNEGLKINGLKSVFTSSENENESLTLYECGKWWFKMRITSSDLDTCQMSQLEKNVMDYFVPTNYVKNDPLGLKFDVHVAPAAIPDSLMLCCVLGAIIGELQWIDENVDSLERISGFPSLYLEAQMASVEGFVKAEKDHPELPGGEEIHHQLEQLNRIIDNGFLEEYLVDQYFGWLIIPKDTVIDSDAFLEWQAQNPIDVLLGPRAITFMWLIECADFD
ncbi:MAG: hypothetical protein IKX35_04990 [Bacteroidales bacterium]|nr:hypothetical protein [Bacteroidales bacterium]